MSILDDAIREHLELKRAHGADDAELKKLEDEAFGPPVRPDEPDPLAEAPTEFLTTPEVDAGEPAEEDSGGRRVPNVADLQEAPVEEEPAMEHEAIVDPSHSTEERHAIAEQPTEMFDVAGQFEDAATESDAPSDEELVDAELGEPPLAPVDPLAGIEASAPGAEAPTEPAGADDEPEDEFDEFFSEQRLSDELNQALEAPLPDEPGAPATEEAPAVFVDVDEEEADEEESGEHQPVEGVSDEHEIAADEHDEEADEDAPAASQPEAGHDDVLEDTPEFLQDDPEDDELWFEQKPPKDIDFGD